MPKSRQAKFTLPDELRERLQEEARRTDRSEAAVVRLALRMYLGVKTAAKR